MERIIQKAKELALDEIKRYGLPYLFHFNISLEKGQELAEKLSANKDIVMLGTILMDIKLGQAKHEGKLAEHVNMSVKTTEEFLSQFNISNEIKSKIINCVEAHHETKGFIYKEAKICANAECYRFLHPKAIFMYMGMLNKRFDGDIKKVIEQAKSKMEEKHKVLSLDICKKELDDYYEIFKKLFEAAK